MLCDFEPVKYCNAAPRLSAGTSRRSTWTRAPKEDARFRVAAREHTFDQAVLDEHVHDRRIRAGRQDVDVAARLAAASEAADRGDRRGGKTLLEEGDDRAGDVVGDRQQMPAGMTLPLFDRFQDQRFFLGAHPLDGSNAAVERGALQIVECLDAELTMQHRDRLRADTLEPHHFENRWREFAQQIAMKLGVACRRDLADLAGEVFPDTRDLSERRFIERGQVVRVIAGDVGDVAVRPDLEGVVALDFEEVGDFPEDVGDGGVIQPEDLLSRYESPARGPRPVSTQRQWRLVGQAARSKTGSRRRRRRTPSPRLRRRTERDA